MDNPIFALFGDPDEAALWKQTPLGIHYQAHGFDERPRKQKRIEKRLNRALRWMTEEGVPEYVRSEFIRYYNEFPDKLATWLDEAYHVIHDTRWPPCTTRYPGLLRIRPDQIRITLVPAPFYVPFYQKFACGMMEPGREGAITLCVAAVSRGNATPELNWLRRVGDLARWEIGNYGATYVAGIKDREIGDGALC